MIDIVFCLDATGSMGPYIISTLETIRRLTEHVIIKAEKDALFGFVAYRDHDDE
jgi:hypothetical protein